MKRALLLFPFIIAVAGCPSGGNGPNVVNSPAPDAMATTLAKN